MAPIALGKLIRLLELEDREDPERTVSFDFGGLIPRGVTSYRGFYEQLAITYDDDWQNPQLVADFLAELRSAVGKTFTGYKGGEYVMRQDTPVWAANYGECNNTAVTGLANCSWRTIISTEWVDR